MYPYSILPFLGGGIRLYGVCIALGLIACLIAFYILSKKGGMPERIQDYVFFVLIGALVVGFFFAMLFQAFYNWLDGKPFKLFGSGLTVMGGLVGGAGAFLLLYFLVGKFYFKGKEEGLHKKHFNTLFRVAPICICIAHGFGRMGCLMAGCCHGRYYGMEHVSGTIYMDGAKYGWGYYVPTQLYEAIFLFALATVLTILYFKRCNIIMSLYLIGYGIWRFIIEYFRDDYRGFGETLYPSQWMSIIFFAISVALLLFYYFKKLPYFLPKKKEDKPQQIEQT